MDILTNLARSLGSGLDACTEDGSVAARILDAIPDPVILKNSDQRIVLANFAFCRLMRLLRSDVLGRRSTDLSPYLDAEAVNDGDRRVLSGEPGCQAMVRMGPDSDLRYFTVKKVPIRDERGVVGVLALIHDITDAKRAEQQIAQAKADAARTEAVRTKFIADAGHDLSQPMQTLYLAFDALRSHVAPEGMSCIGRIDQALNILKTYVEGLLDVNRLNEKLVQPLTEIVPLREVFAQLTEEYAAIARQKGLHLHVAPTDLVVSADRILLTRMLTHILQNALSFTITGEVSIDCNTDGDTVSIEVADTGIGIAAHHIDRIFDEQFQVSNANRDNTKGFGLGLSLVKKISQLTGYPVSVVSTVNRGSRFQVRVVAAPALPPSYLYPSSTAPRRDPLALVVDDDEFLREAIEGQVEDWGYRVIGASSSDRLLPLLDAAHRPDILLLDYRLVRETGVDVLLKLRRFFQDETLPAVLLTGDGDDTVRQQAKSHGMRLVMKPASAGQLRAAVEDLTRSSVAGD